MNQTYREMKGQYDALSKTVKYMRQHKQEITDIYSSFNPSSIVFLGCGSSYCLTQSSEVTAHLSLDIPAFAIPAGDLMLRADYYYNIIKNSIFVIQSRSGNTSELIMAIEAARKITEIKVIAISCTENSDISRVADITLSLPWAFDESVCQTRTVSNLYVANLVLLKTISGDNSMDDQIDKMIKQGPAFMEKYEARLNEIAARDWNYVLILADGEMRGIASEGIMAFCEIPQIAGHHYHLLDVRHGPMVLVDNKTLVIAAITDENSELQVNVVKDLVSRGAIVVLYRTDNGANIPGVALEVRFESELDLALHGVPLINIAQIISIAKADELGINPDVPEGIVACVKL